MTTSKDFLPAFVFKVVPAGTNISIQSRGPMPAMVQKKKVANLGGGHWTPANFPRATGSGTPPPLCPPTSHLTKGPPCGRWTSRSVKMELPFLGGQKRGLEKKKLPSYLSLVPQKPNTETQYDTGKKNCKLPCHFHAYLMASLRKKLRSIHLVGGGLNQKEQTNQI